MHLRKVYFYISSTATQHRLKHWDTHVPKKLFNCWTPYDRITEQLRTAAGHLLQPAQIRASSIRLLENLSRWVL